MHNILNIMNKFLINYKLKNNEKTFAYHLDNLKFAFNINSLSIFLVFSSAKNSIIYWISINFENYDFVITNKQWKSLILPYLRIMAFVCSIILTIVFSPKIIFRCLKHSIYVPRNVQKKNFFHSIPTRDLKQHTPLVSDESLTAIFKII